MHSTRRPVWLLTLLWVVILAGYGEDKPKPISIPLVPFGIPKAMFSNNLLHACLHEHAAGTRLFWLDSSHIFVAFTTNPPCTFRSHSEPDALRVLVFDSSSGAKIASHDWPLEDDITLFAGPHHSVVLWQGSKLEFLDDHLHIVEAGELAEKPKGLWVTPARRTIPLLSADGRNFEFYGAGPLRLLTTIAIDQSTEANSVEDWTPGDERVAGTRCRTKSDYSCNKILVLTADANFLAPDGAPWSYEETEKPVLLRPIAFLDPTHLLISRQEKGFFHNPQTFIVRPDGSRTLLSTPGGQLYLRGIAGIAAGGTRFALEYCAQGLDEDCLAFKRFIVEEVDRKKTLFEKNASSVFSRAQLSPDGKSIAILDDGVVTIYPLSPP